MQRPTFAGKSRVGSVPPHWAGGVLVMTLLATLNSAMLHYTKLHCATESSAPPQVVCLPARSWSPDRDKCTPGEHNKTGRYRGLFNRPGVAGAVLQTPLLLIHSVSR